SACPRGSPASTAWASAVGWACAAGACPRGHTAAWERQRGQAPRACPPYIALVSEEAGPRMKGLKMLRELQSSTSIMSIGYDKASRILEVEFVSGGIYQYYDVPVDLYSQLLKAESKGQFVNTMIKPVFL